MAAGIITTKGAACDDLAAVTRLGAPNAWSPMSRTVSALIWATAVPATSISVMPSRIDSWIRSSMRPLRWRRSLSAR